MNSRLWVDDNCYQRFSLIRTCQHRGNCGNALTILIEENLLDDHLRARFKRNSEWGNLGISFFFEEQEQDRNENALRERLNFICLLLVRSSVQFHTFHLVINLGNCSI